MEEKEIVNEFYQEHSSLKRTFPLNLVDLAKCLGYTIFYISNKDKKYQDKAILVFTNDKKIFINEVYRKDLSWFMKGRYLITKMLAHIILKNIDTYWEESLNHLVSQFSEEDQEKNKKATRLCFELLMPEDVFVNQWKLLGGDKTKLSQIFGVSQEKVSERHVYLEIKNDIEKK